MKPFLKWAGGKRWLFDSEFLSSLPTFDRYIEPFLGGGAGFFAIQPKSAVLADINPELINLYCVIRSNAAMIERALAWGQRRHSREFYYKVRSFQPRSSVGRAARTLYLNRSCWNGLYRLNRNGKFNVPIGTKSQIELPLGSLPDASSSLAKADLVCSDFEPIVDMAGTGDLLFVDPPYTVKHNFNGFVKYNEAIFSWADQVRLRDALYRARNRGATILMTNADHESVRELYTDVYDARSVGRASVISGSTSGRARTTELLVRL